MRSNSCACACWSTSASEDDIADAVEEAASARLNILNVVDRNARAFENATDLADKENGKGHRCPVWWFASELRGYPDIGDLPSWEAVRIVDEALAPLGGWDLLPQEDVWRAALDPRDEFLRVWSLIDKPLDIVIEPQAALPFVERWPLTSDRSNSEKDAGWRKAIGVLFWYGQILCAGGHFFISSRKLGDVLGKSHVQALNYLHRAQQEDEGLLELIEKGEKGRWGRAARYRFRTEAVTLAPSIEEKSPIGDFVTDDKRQRRTA